ncbi:MAG: ABC transporter permease [Chloroflexi bacterium]|nr:ABC transporter permease [Chloroflexota bacterium]
MNKALLVARHEYLFNVRRRGFLFAAFGVPLLTIVMLFFVFSATTEAETNVGAVGTVGYIDLAGVLVARIDEPDYFAAYDDEATARAAIDAGELGAYFVVTENYLETGAVNLVASAGVPEALEDAIEAFLAVNVGRELDPTVRSRIGAAGPFEMQLLNSGRSFDQENAVLSLFMTPLIFIIIFMISSQTTSGYLMSGVVEEKTNRIMEILVTSVTPFQLFAGKLLGLGALGLTQVVIWGAVGALAIPLTQAGDPLGGIAIPADLVIIGLIYFVFGYFLFASIMAAIGVVVGSEQESRQYAGLLSLGLALPLFFMFSFITDPDGGIATALTLFPLTAPSAIILRLGFGAVPVWQIGLSLGLLVLATIFFVWMSARIFRWALLLYGKRPGLREVLRAIRRRPAMATSATEPQAQERQTA